MGPLPTLAVDLPIPMVDLSTLAVDLSTVVVPVVVPVVVTVVGSSRLSLLWPGLASQIQSPGCSYAYSLL